MEPRATRFYFDANQKCLGWLHNDIQDRNYSGDYYASEDIRVPDDWDYNPVGKTYTEIMDDRSAELSRRFHAKAAQ